MSEQFDISLYNDEFFKWHKTHVHEDCVKMGYAIGMECTDLTSAIDFGCGIGSVLLGLKKSGIQDVEGLDIGGKDAKAYADPQIVGHIDFNFDVTKDNISDEKYDLALCLEVAEHIQTQYSDRLVKLICDHARKMIIFTGADVGQEGCGHINCQPKSFWIEKFEANGWEWDQHLTHYAITVWFPFIADYYKKNLMIFFPKK